MNIVGIIPARMAASRFPNKPMAPILGMPMIGHVYHRSRFCKGLSDVWVATCDAEILNYIHSIGGKAVMTADTHQRASDRAAEALLKIEEATDRRVDYAAMIQGDEPMLAPEMIDDLIRPVLKDPQVRVTNLINRIEDDQEFDNANVVKVVRDREGFALYFSREPIPSKRKFNGELPRWKQLGIILFSRDALLDYIGLTPTPLEIVESVDMNRFLEHGIRIKMIETSFKSSGVDVPADVPYVEAQLRRDNLLNQYLERK